MAVFVINEWLWHDSSGENGPSRQRETSAFIENIPTSGHQIAFIEGSSFDKKAWTLCKSGDLIALEIARSFVLGVRLNSKCGLILKVDAVVAVPAELAGATKLDDHYLLQALLSVPGAILVTTDDPLREAVTNAGHPCLSRDDFLATYFQH